MAAILDVVGDSEELPRAQIARRTGLPRSSVHRMLQRMVGLEWVERRGYAYRLGVRMMELGTHVLLQDRLQRAAIRCMYELRDKTGQSVHLATLTGMETITLETV
ncbi:helix-turn-helix domain-containing protein [Streptomyces sp. NPDC055681]